MGKTKGQSWYAEGTQHISGGTYVPARERTDGSSLIRLRIVSERNCDHETTICMGKLPEDDDSLVSLTDAKTCIESWSLDWELLFGRTVGGRRLQEVQDARYP